MLNVLMISSDTCGPCKMLKPLLIEEVDKLGISLSIYTISGPADELVQKYNVRSVPTVLLREGDKVLDQFTGMNTQEFIKDFLTQQEVNE